MDEIITFSGAQIAGVWVATSLCILVPIAIFLFYASRKVAKLSSFFIGTGAFLLISLLGRQVFNLLLALLFGDSSIFDAGVHPVYASLYSAIAGGIFTQGATYLALRFAMGDRSDKRNCFFMNIGKAGLECLLSGGFASISFLSLAYSINSMGSEAYLSSIDASLRADAAAAIITQASEPVYQIVLDGVVQVAYMALNIALGVLVYISLHSAEELLPRVHGTEESVPWYISYRGMMTPLAMLVDALCLFPIYLMQVGLVPADAIPVVLPITIIAMVLVSYGCYMIYKKLA